MYESSSSRTVTDCEATYITPGLQSSRPGDVATTENEVNGPLYINVLDGFIYCDVT